jgi:hypothetical protein
LGFVLGLEGRWRHVRKHINPRALSGSMHTDQTDGMLPNHRNMDYVTLVYTEILCEIWTHYSFFFSSIIIYPNYKKMLFGTCIFLKHGLAAPHGRKVYMTYIL